MRLSLIEMMSRMFRYTINVISISTIGASANPAWTGKQAGRGGGGGNMGPMLAGKQPGGKRHVAETRERAGASSGVEQSRN